MRESLHVRASQWVQYRSRPVVGPRMTALRTDHTTSRVSGELCSHLLVFGSAIATAVVCARCVKALFVGTPPE